MMIAACDSSNRGHPDGGGAGGDLAGQPGAGQEGCIPGEFVGCYSVYAHADHVLYRIDLQNKDLVTVGPFNAPQVGGKEDVITDLAVSPDNLIYVISKTTLYTADPNDGHVTKVGDVGACGTYAVALTFENDGSLYAADFNGQFCKIDRSTTPPTVTPIAMIGQGLAIAGDIVAVGDGTMYGTAYKLADGSSGATALNNILVKIDPSSGMVSTQVGSTGFPKMFGIAYALGHVFGFTHDGSGDVVTIDPKSGKGTLYNSFKDPSTNMPISFAGAGVNSLVSPTIM
jgi:hypothetical protein